MRGGAERSRSIEVEPGMLRSTRGLPSAESAGGFRAVRWTERLSSTHERLGPGRTVGTIVIGPHKAIIIDRSGTALMPRSGAKLDILRQSITS